METGRMSEGPGSSGCGSSLSAKGGCPSVVGRILLADSMPARHPGHGRAGGFQMVIQIVTIKIAGMRGAHRTNLNLFGQILAKIAFMKHFNLKEAKHPAPMTRIRRPPSLHSADPCDAHARLAPTSVASVPRCYPTVVEWRPVRRMVALTAH